MADDFEIAPGQTNQQPVDPETPAEAAGEVPPPTAGDAPNDDATTPPERRPRQRTRRLNPELFAKAAASVRAQLEEEARDYAGQAAPPPTDDDEDEPAAPAGDAAAPVGDAPPPAQAGPAPELVEAWERVNERNTELSAREERLAELERRYDAIAKIGEDPLAAIRAIVKISLGPMATEADIEDEVAHVVTMSGVTLTGAKMPTDNPAYQQRQQKRELAALRRKVDADRRSVDDERRANEERSKEAQAVAAIGEEFAKVAKSFPWTSAAGDAGSRIWQVAVQEAEAARARGQAYQVKPVAYYAKIVEAQVQEAANKHVKPFLHLLTPNAPPSGAAPKVTVPQGNHQRRPATLTNRTASEEPSTPATPPGPPLTGEARRRATFEKWRGKIRAD